MKKTLIFLSLAFLVACKGGESGQKNQNPPAHGSGDQLPPAPEPQPVPPPVPPPAPTPDAGFYPDLTPYGVSEIRRELKELLTGSDFESRPLSEKQILVGASLDQASRNLNLELDWQKVTEKDLKRLLDLFFTENLELKKEIL